MLSIICGARVAAQPPPLGSETRESVVSDIRRTRLITPQIVRRERRGGPKIRRTRLMTDLPLQARGGMILAKAYAPYPLIIATKATPARPRCAVGASQAHRTPEASGALHAPHSGRDAAASATADAFLVYPPAIPQHHLLPAAYTYVHARKTALTSEVKCRESTRPQASLT